MSDDYGHATFRKSKRDKRMKSRYNKYKKGGKYRVTNVQEGKNKNA